MLLKKKSRIENSKNIARENKRKCARRETIIKEKRKSKGIEYKAKDNCKGKRKWDKKKKIVRK